MTYDASKNYLTTPARLISTTYDTKKNRVSTCDARRQTYNPVIDVSKNSDAKSYKCVDGNTFNPIRMYAWDIIFISLGNLISTSASPRLDVCIVRDVARIFKGGGGGGGRPLTKKGNVMYGV